IFAAPATALAFALPRLVLATTRGAAARAWPGLGAGVRSAGAPFQRGAPWVWSAVLSSALYVRVSYALTICVDKQVKDPQLLAASLAVIQLGLVAFLGLLAYLVAAGGRRVGERIAPRLGRWNPLGRVAAALAALVLLAIPVVAVLLRHMPALRDVMPWR